MSPIISIIIPTYKRPEKLAIALASIQTASQQVYEVIVIDDCPEGSAFAVAMQFKTQYLCKAGHNRGLSKSRNLGINLSKGQYLVFLDDDDFFSPNGLEALYQTICTGYSFVYGDYSNLFPQQKVRVDLALLSHEHLLICNQIPVGAYMIDRGSIRRNFDERMRSHEDWEFLLSNLEWNHCKHVPLEVVNIDKTENMESSMQARRRQYFWLDFISIYSRFPAPHLSAFRQKCLLELGINIDENSLKHEDVI